MEKLQKKHAIYMRQIIIICSYNICNIIIINDEADLENVTVCMWSRFTEEGNSIILPSDYFFSHPSDCDVEVICPIHRCPTEGGGCTADGGCSLDGGVCSLDGGVCSLDGGVCL